jgi:FkbM family methyltransferase
MLKAALRSVMPPTVKARRIRFGPLRGCQLVTSWRDYPAALLGYTERPLLRWLTANVHPGETWLDVGAHYGYTALALSRLVGPEGRVFAFEPVPTTAGYLATTRSRNDLCQLTVLPIGLSDAPSITAIDVALVRGMAEHGRAATMDRVTIVVGALDGIWDGLARDHRAIHGVKVDVQGMEVETLEGMRGLLREFRPRLVVEFHAGADRPAAMRLLDELGYRLPGAPLTRRAAEPAEAEADDSSYAFVPAAIEVSR